MTPKDRVTLKKMIDQAVREQTTISGRSLCFGCGGPLTEYTWSCGACRDRYRRQQQRIFEKLEMRIEILEQEKSELELLVSQQRAAIRSLRQGQRRGYATEEERLEARRRTWRESQKRRYHEKKTSPATPESV